MLRRVAYLAVLAGVVGILGGCAITMLRFDTRAAWRDAEEEACMAAPVELVAVHYTPVARIDGRGACGIARPLKVAAFNDGYVAVNPGPTIGCPMAAALDAWMTASVQPAALAFFGLPVVEIQELDAYSCRPVNNVPGEKLSEHAFGNAIDIAGFRLANGRLITVKRDFRFGDRRARGFLTEIFATACAQFKTALGPGEPNHEDHFHLDLAHHNANGTSRYCNPKPRMTPPIREPYFAPSVASSSVLPTVRAILGADRGTGSVAAGAPRG
jgi:hypothetical protein